MGWIHCFTSPYAVYKNGGATMPPASRRMECDKMLTWDAKDSDGNILSSHRVLKSAMVGSTYYAAVTTERKGEPTKVWAAVFLTCGRTRHDGTIWGYKDMDETVGPCEDKCPASILALLTPTDSDWANQWRERCRKNIEAAAKARKNGPAPLYAPAGVEISVEGKSWIISSRQYRYTHAYSGVRFSKARFHTSDCAMKCFLHNYGTSEQKQEFALSGRECPAEWKHEVA